MSLQPSTPFYCKRLVVVDDAERVYAAYANTLFVNEVTDDGGSAWVPCFADAAGASGSIVKDGPTGRATSVFIDAITTDGSTAELVDGGVLRLFSPWKAVDFYIGLLQNLLSAGGCTAATSTNLYAAVVAAEKAKACIEAMDAIQVQRNGKPTGQTEYGTVSNSVRKGVTLLAKRLRDIYNKYGSYVNIIPMALTELESEKIFSIIYMHSGCGTVAMTPQQFSVGVGRTVDFLFQTSPANTGSQFRRLTKQTTPNRMYLNAHRRPAAVEDGGVDVAHRPGLLQKVEGDDYNRLSGCIKRVAAAANEPRQRVRGLYHGGLSDNLVTQKHTVAADRLQPQQVLAPATGAANEHASAAGVHDHANRSHGNDSDSEEDDAERLAWEKDDDDSDGDDDVAAAAAEIEEEQGEEGDPHAPRAVSQSIVSMQLPLFRGGQLVAVVAPSASQSRHGLF